jgi:hypothetical protein
LTLAKSARVKTTGSYPRGARTGGPHLALLGSGRLSLNPQGGAFPSKLHSRSNYGMDLLTKQLWRIDLSSPSSFWFSTVFVRFGGPSGSIWRPERPRAAGRKVPPAKFWPKKFRRRNYSRYLRPSVIEIFTRNFDTSIFSESRFMQSRGDEIHTTETNRSLPTAVQGAYKRKGHPRRQTSGGCRTAIQRL